jgi:carboxylesterase
MNSKTYLPGAEPLFLKGSNIGCLLLHGAGGGTAWDLKEFAHFLHDQIGATVSVPALQGFGTKPEDLYEVTFNDWMNDAKNALSQVQETCTSIVIVGHSFGGLLGLILAAQNSSIDVLVTWAAAYKISDRRLAFLPTISKIPLINRVLPEKFDMTPSADLIAEGWVGYDWMPLSIVHVIIEGLRTSQKLLTSVICPTFVIQGTLDESVSQDSPQIIYQKISSKKKDMWLVEGAHHPLMQETQFKGELFSRTLAFIQKNLEKTE